MSDQLDENQPLVIAEGLEDPGVPEPAQVNPLPKRRKSLLSWRRDWPVLLLVGAILAGWVLYAVILPPLEIRQKIAQSKWRFDPRDPEISFRIWFIRRTVEYWFVFWFFYLGACIGSFINVVASRTPQKKTIVTRGSHCPFCDKPLNMIDNSPVFGWILLRGRCRACRLPISPRYLIMEIAVGLIFVTLGAIELIGNGVNLPYREWRFGVGIVSTVFYPKWGLIGAMALHLSLFSVAVMLIGTQFERLKFPKLPLLVILGIYIASFIANPIVSRVRWTEPWGARFLNYSPQFLERAITAGLGTSIGFLLGLLTGKLIDRIYFHSIDSPLDKRAWFWHWTILHGLAGALFGWQLIGLTSLLGSLLAMAVCGYLLSRKSDCSSDRKPDFQVRVIALAIWTCTLLVHVCTWRWIAMVWST
ncbi:MAG: prepilin peptidase [Pirellula sp.]